jgi:flagellar biosynthesis chaperone FliJ
MNQQYVEKLERAIEEHLNNIDKIQAALTQEEEKLQKCFMEIRFYEPNYEVADYCSLVTAIA